MTHWTAIQAMENGRKDMSLIWLIEHIQESLSFQLEVNWIKIGGVIDVPGDCASKFWWSNSSNPYNAVDYRFFIWRPNAILGEITLDYKQPLPWIIMMTTNPIDLNFDSL